MGVKPLQEAELRGIREERLKLVLFLRHHQAGRRHTDHIISHTAAAVIIILIVLKSHQLMRRADLQIREQSAGGAGAGYLPYRL